jgi:hypothetical protein
LVLFIDTFFMNEIFRWGGLLLPIVCGKTPHPYGTSHTSTLYAP